VAFAGRQPGGVYRGRFWCAPKWRGLAWFGAFFWLRPHEPWAVLAWRERKVEQESSGSGHLSNGSTNVP
jgi:hypothetical protein